MRGSLCQNGGLDSMFPLTSSNSGLGFDFGLIRGAAEVRTPAAITRLDEVRTADLTQSREHLKHR